MAAALPWLADFNKKMQSYFEQDFAAALEFAHKLRQAKDMQDFLRIQFEYIQRCLQSFAAQAKDFSDTCTKVASGAIKAPPMYSAEQTMNPNIECTSMSTAVGQPQIRQWVRLSLPTGCLANSRRSR